VVPPRTSDSTLPGGEPVFLPWRPPVTVSGPFTKAVGQPLRPHAKLCGGPRGLGVSVLPPLASPQKQFVHVVTVSGHRPESGCSRPCPRSAVTHRSARRPHQPRAAPPGPRDPT